MGLFEYGYEKPSPIQEEVLPYALAGSIKFAIFIRSACNCKSKKWNRKDWRISNPDP
jgi:hypothetical protein